MGRVLVVLAAGFALALPVRAQSFTLTGFLDDGAVAAEGLFTFAFALRDADTTLWSEEQSGVVVVDGVFAVDVGSAVPLPRAVPSGARLFVTIDGDELPPVSLARLARAARATTTVDADTATNTARLNGLSSSSFVTADALARPGGAAVPFAVLADVSGDLADGDNGTVVTATSDGVVLVDGVLSLSAVPGDRLAARSVTSATIPDGTVQSRHVVDGSIGTLQVAAGNILRATLAGDVTDREVRSTPVFRVDAVGCPVERGFLTRSSTCVPTACTAVIVINGFDTLVSGRTRCDGTGCIAGTPTCPNTPLGSLVRP